MIASEWTTDRVKDLLSDEVRKCHEAKFSEDRRNVFYRAVAEIQNLIEAEGWRLEPPKLNRENSASFLTHNGVTKTRRPFGVLLAVILPHEEAKDRQGNRPRDLSQRTNPPRVVVVITEEEARYLEHKHGCKFWWIGRRLVYYNIPEDITELLPVLEFAYRKHSGN